MIDKRKFPRLSEMWKMNYKTITSNVSKKSPIRSLTVNISGGGICFEADEKISIGDILAIELESTSLPSSIIAFAEAKWCKKKSEEEKYEVGAEFCWIGWIDNDAQMAVAEYVKNKSPESE
jgi:c-di-GMP-binding flagellar brake protein YcgR